MTYVPAALRRTGYHYESAAVSVAVRGFSALPVEQQHALRCGVAHVRKLGDRALAELLIELAERRASLPDTLTTLSSWRSRLTPEMTRAARADAFSSRSLRSVA